MDWQKILDWAKAKWPRYPYNKECTSTADWGICSAGNLECWWTDKGTGAYDVIRPAWEAEQAEKAKLTQATIVWDSETAPKPPPPKPEESWVWEYNTLSEPAWRKYGGPYATYTEACKAIKGFYATMEVVDFPMNEGNGQRIHRV